MSLKTDLGAALATFVVESRELLTGMEEGLLELERAGADQPAAVNAVFRAAHTIKGSSGIFGLEHLVRFTHVVESVLVQVREGRRPVTPELIASLLACRDHLGELVESVQEGAPAEDPAREARGAQLLARLEPSGGAAPAPSRQPTPAAAPAVRWSLDLRLSPDCLRGGMDPLPFLRHLETLGRLHALTVDASALPEPAAFDPETLYLRFRVELETPASEAQIRGVFEFVTDGSLITLTPSAPAVPAAPPPAPAAAQRGPREGAASATVRIDAGRLDALVDAVGQLVIAGSGLGRRMGVDPASPAGDALGELIQLVEGVRESALRLRLVPLGTVFGRFPRVVRDLSQQLGKTVELVVSGAETEIDRFLAESLTDPLLHLVRNSLDHGLEAPQTRASRGKPPTGTLTLSARQEGGAVVITVGDDGNGLNLERIKQKATDVGLVPPGQHLSEREVAELIFQPGFSTAAAVTDVSGRGVGLDVVKRAVSAMRGTIEIETSAGRGTVFVLRLPLTLSIIDGFEVRVAGTSFVIPLEHVQECLDLPSEAGPRSLTHRGCWLPLIDPRDVLRLEGAPPQRRGLVVVQLPAGRAGVIVDALVGKAQVVVKPLAGLLTLGAGLAGSTILGDGGVALILDVPELFRLARLAGAQSSLSGLHSRGPARTQPAGPPAP